MGKVNPGDPLKLPATEWNTMLDVAGDYRLGRLGGGGSAGVPGYGSVILPVKNNTGSALARYHALALGDPLFTHATSAQAFLNQLAFNGETMAASYFGKFAVATEAIANGKIGRAVLQGITVAQITVTHADNDRVDIDPAGGSQLVSAFYGAGEILYKEAGTGTKWAIIRVGSFVSPQLEATASEAIAVSAGGDVEIQRGGVGSETVTAYLTWMAGTEAVAEGDQLVIEFMPDQNRYVIHGASCAAA